MDDREMVLEALDRALGRFVHSANHPRRAEQINEWAGTNIERSGYIFLRLVEDHPGLRLVALADVAAIDISTASRQVGRLVEAGLIERLPDPTEHRAYLHHLTPTGVATLDRVRAARLDWLAVRVDDVDTDHLTELARFLVDIADRMDSEDRDSRETRRSASS